jgi:hypothetical protein
MDFTESKSDRLDPSRSTTQVINDSFEKDLSEYFGITEEDTQENTDVSVTPELIKKLVYNPGGILPYFPPNKDK